MRVWFSLSDAAAVRVAGFPETRFGWSKIADREGWRGSGRARRVGRGWEFHISLFPEQVQAALASGRAETAAADWSRFEQLPEHVRAEAAQRVDAIRRFEAALATGRRKGEAIAMVASADGISPSTLRRWIDRVAGLPASDWLAALAPRREGRSRHAACHPQAWAVLTSDYLRPEAPGFSACYRRLRAAAEREGWAPIPSEAALRRRLEAEVPKAVVVARRKGREAAARLQPAQRRSKADLHAMQAITLDGHTFDVMVRRPHGNGAPFRPCLVAAQDIASGKLIAWRLAESESRISVRLALGDVVERYGIPDEAILDNGRGFASKWITGGQPTRYCFKIKDDEPDGLLTLLGVTVHWATPYHGQSKPIERAFRDLCEDIAKHPFCAGAYTGNSPVTKPDNYGSRALEWDEFRLFVDARIADHNARPGRKSPAAKGRSLDETFRASMAAPDTVVRRATPAQRDFWLLAAEGVTARRPSGEVHLLGARYWAPEMMDHVGRKVVARFDPDDLTRPARIYTTAGQLICTAEAIEDVPFLSAEDAQRRAREARTFRKHVRALEEQHVQMPPEELARLYAPTRPAPADEPPGRPAVTRLATAGSAARKVKEQAEWTEEHEEAFARAADQAGARLLKFP